MNLIPRKSVCVFCQSNLGFSSFIYRKNLSQFGTIHGICTGNLKIAKSYLIPQIKVGLSPVSLFAQRKVNIFVPKKKKELNI